jgi:hypothetical protein
MPGGISACQGRPYGNGEVFADLIPALYAMASSAA